MFFSRYLNAAFPAELRDSRSAFSLDVRDFFWPPFSAFVLRAAERRLNSPSLSRSRVLLSNLLLEAGSCFQVPFGVFNDQCPLFDFEELKSWQCSTHLIISTCKFSSTGARLKGGPQVV